MQKLSYRDRIIILIVLIIMILVIGFMLLIKPKFKDISAAEDSLNNAQSQWNEIENKINQVDTIKERVQKKYNESVELGNLFVDLKRAYTLEKFIQEYFNKNGVYINTNASYSDPSVITLTPYSINYESLDYSIGQSANLNSTDIEDQTEDVNTDESQEKSLPCGTVTIDYYATRSGLLQFMQDIKESGKTIEIKSLTIGNNSYNTDPSSVLTGDMTIDVYYAEMISDLEIGEEINSSID